MRRYPNKQRVWPLITRQESAKLLKGGHIIFIWEREYIDGANTNGHSIAAVSDIPDYLDALPPRLPSLFH